jgi:predicted nucleotidyltransferase
MNALQAAEPLTPGLCAVLAQHPVLQLALLFGSVAAGRARADSDLDIAVLADAPLDATQRIALAGELAEVSGRAVDLIDLRTAGEPLLGEVLMHGRRLLGSPEAFAALLSRRLTDAADFAPYAERIVAQRRRAWTGR